MTRCRRCETDLEHCHGTLVRHTGGTWECTAQSADRTGTCTGDGAMHDFVLDCADLWTGCCDATAGSGRSWSSAGQEWSADQERSGGQVTHVA